MAATSRPSRFIAFAPNVVSHPSEIARCREEFVSSRSVHVRAEQRITTLALGANERRVTVATQRAGWVMLDIDAVDEAVLVIAAT
jgi:hypothetical protein